MNHYTRIFFFILPLVFLSGCTGIPGIPGGDVIKITPTTEEEGFRDVLVIKEINTIPKSPILAGQTVLMSFIIENRDREKEAKEVVVDLFDAPQFKHKKDTTPQSEKLCNSAPNICVPESCTPGQPCAITSILPGEQKQITFELLAPDDKAIAGLQTDVDLNFRVTYKFDGSMLLKLVVVNLDEIKARQRAGSPISIDVPKSIGSGPVKIDAELKGSPYILSELGGTLAFTIKSTGDTAKGSIKNSAVPKADGKSGLSVEFPKDLLNDVNDLSAPSPEESCPPSEKCEWVFECNKQSDPIKCTNKGKELTLFKGESAPLLFRILKSKKIDTPFRSFDIKASIDYTYELRDSTKVTVVPLTKVQ